MTAPGFLERQAPPPEPHHQTSFTLTPWPWLFAILLAAVSIAASAFRIVLAPGVELYLGPAFYLLAYRVGGIRFALPVALLTMAPSWFWWGHVFSIALAAGQLFFIDRVWRPVRSLALATLVYSLTVGVVTGYLFLHFHYHASGTIIVLSIIRKMLNDVMLAALVDLGWAIFSLDLRAGRILRQRHIQFASIVVASVTLIIMASTVMLFVSNARQFPPYFGLLRKQMALEVELRLGQAVDAGLPVEGFRMLESPQGGVQEVAVASRRETLLAAPIRSKLGCSRIDDGAPVSGPNDRNTFAYWVTACVLAPVRFEGHSAWFIYSTRTFAEEAYRRLVGALVGPAVLLGLWLLLGLFITRAVNRSLSAWRAVVAAFGDQDIAVPKQFLFSEFEQPIQAIVAANNQFAALVAERAAVAKATVELKREMDLSLATDIRFDEAAGTLSFVEVSMDRPSSARVVAVHPNDRMVFASQLNCEEAVAEFRVSEANNTEWYFLVGRDLTAPGRWRSGWMVRLRQSKLAQDRMLHHARLVDLGGMASAISHELKQPLSTISLSAENGRLLIDKASPAAVEAARAKFDRILEQVDRARDIIVRISRYARIEDDDPEPVDLAQVVNTAMTFMRPLLVQENVSARIDLRFARPPQLLLSRVGLEQIFVNAIQNAVDAIVSRRAAGEADLAGTIDVVAALTDAGLTIRIIDNGTGLTLGHAETAFDAFVTTKPWDRGTGLGLYISRQIVTEIGGAIAIRSRPSPERGAEMTIDLPPFIIAAKRGGRGA